MNKEIENIRIDREKAKAIARKLQSERTQINFIRIQNRQKPASSHGEKA